MKKILPIVLKMWPANEMAEIMQGKESLHLGNYWDFHAGCHGAKKFINGKWVSLDKEWTDDIRTPGALANLIARVAGAPLIIKTYKREWSDY